jgi:hypothetical protein
MLLLVAECTTAPHQGADDEGTSEGTSLHEVGPMLTEPLNSSTSSSAVTLCPANRCLYMKRHVVQVPSTGGCSVDQKYRQWQVLKATALLTLHQQGTDATHLLVID